jgi:Domain of unknown function (DUF362)
MNRNKKSKDCQGYLLKRRDFLKIGGTLGAGLILSPTHPLFGSEEEIKPPSNWKKPKTNIAEALKVPRTSTSLPGPFPGRVVQVHEASAMSNGVPHAPTVEMMIRRGIQNLTGKDLKESFNMLFSHDDVIGIKVNPVGAKLISTHLEVVDGIIHWLLENGMKRRNIIIWDRFDYMLEDAGFTAQRFPGIPIVGMQTMDVEVFKKTWNKRDHERKTGGQVTWLDKTGKHISAANFDDQLYYWADVEAPKDVIYLNKNVNAGKHSFFGKLLTQKLTKIINVPVFKNIAHGVSMATKNISYGSITNCARLHFPLFLYVNTEVMAFPVIRDKLVLNIIDGLKGQYDAGPTPAPKYQYDLNTLFFATDPIALDMTCHKIITKKRKEMKIKVNESPRFSEYLTYGQELGLGIADSRKIQVIRA